MDQKTVDDFGRQWARFDQTGPPSGELERDFQAYFRVFPWDNVGPEAVGFDAGCGSGRWARFVLPRIGHLHLIEASPQALEVARRNLAGFANCDYILSSLDDLPLAESSLDFGYSVGVLHHLPDPLAGLIGCASRLKPGAPFLAYIYYALDHRPGWYRLLWGLSDLLRRGISRLPFRLKYGLSQVAALLVYLPLARTARLLERLGRQARSVPLYAYRHKSFYAMRTDALDRFGTRLEKRFTADQIRRMMDRAGFERISFSDQGPFWCVVGYRKGISDRNGH